MIDMYLQGDCARLDAQRVLSPMCPRDMDGDPVFSLGSASWMIQEIDAWRRVSLVLRTPGDAPNIFVQCYHRADGDGFIVTDLGEGWHKFRLRTGCIEATQDHVAAWPSEVLFCMECGEPEARTVSSADDLPASLCAVLLSSYRISTLPTKE